MEGYPFKVFETYQNKVLNTELCPISPGQYVICVDTGNVYYDSGENTRKQLTDVIDLETDAQRQAIVAPLDKLYFVKETCHLWRYVNGEWKDLSSGAAAVPDWEQNDPDGLGYIKNRPFYTGTPKWTEWMAKTAVTGDGADAPGMFTKGKTYRVTLYVMRSGTTDHEQFGNATEFVAFQETYGGQTYCELGDGLVKSSAAGFVPAYGVAICTVIEDVSPIIALEITDKTLMMTTFGVSADTAEIGDTDTILAHIEEYDDGVHKIDPKYLPDDIGSGGTSTTNGIHIHDIGSAEFDPSALDFSQYAAGDVVLVVQDMGGGEA